MKSIFIIGANSQDGKILFNKLKHKYRLFNFYRSYYTINESSKKNKFSLNNYKLINYLINKYKPVQIYYLSSYNRPLVLLENNTDDFLKNINVNLVSLQFFLEAIKNFSNKTKLFYASSSFIFNGYNKLRAKEETEPKPNAFYGLTKQFGLEMCNYYRKNFNLFIVVGILFNHDSKLKKKYFFSQKIIKKIKQKNIRKIKINYAHRDWGHAFDYVDAMVLTMKQKIPRNYIIASGKLSTTYEFAKLVIKKLKKKIKIIINKRHSDKLKICGDNQRLIKIGWKPKYTSLNKIVEQIIS